MRQLELQEQQDSPPYELSREELADLKKGFPCLDIRRSCENGSHYTLNPGSWVGVIRLPTLIVRVTPKLSISRVIFLWSYGLDPNHWRDERTSFGEARDLVEAMAHAFKLELDKALRRGVLEGYRLTEESAKTVRGRILLREQWANTLRLRSEVAVAYDEFTLDILENRLLQAAIERISRIRIADEAIRRALFRYARLLGDVSDQYYATGRIPEVHFTHLNRHYERAIFFARMILSAMSFELGDGSVRAHGFLINMNWVFEEFVRVALREALNAPPSRFGKGLLDFDEAKETRLEPDLMWSPHGVPAFVGDVKYKPIIADNADLYQMLAYVVAAHLPSGLLIYPKGEAEETSVRVVNVGRTIETCTLDISAEPKNILDSVGRIADRVCEMTKQAQPW